jgi:hypothetical protein
MRGVGREFGKGLVALGAVGVLMAATPASAALVMATYTGTVASGTDLTGFFHDADLAGDAFTAHFVINTALGQSLNDPGYDARFGGPGFGGGVSPILSADFTLNGVTDSFTMGQDGAGNVFAKNGWEQTFFYANSNTTVGTVSDWDYLQLFVLSSPSPVLLASNFTGTNITVLGDPLETNKVFRQVVDNGHTITSYNLALAPTTVTLAVLSVPEPQTWMMMLTGFLGLGAMLRRRRAVAAA